MKCTAGIFRLIIFSVRNRVTVMQEQIKDLSKAIEDVLDSKLVASSHLAANALRHSKTLLDNQTVAGGQLYQAIWFAIGQIHAEMRIQDECVREYDLDSGSPRMLTHPSDTSRDAIERDLAAARHVFSDIGQGPVSREHVPCLLSNLVEKCVRKVWPEEMRIADRMNTTLADFLNVEKKDPMAGPATPGTRIARSKCKDEQRFAHKAFQIYKEYRNPHAHANQEDVLTTAAIGDYLYGVSRLFEMANQLVAKGPR